MIPMIQDVPGQTLSEEQRAKAQPAHIFAEAPLASGPQTRTAEIANHFGGEVMQVQTSTTKSKPTQQAPKPKPQWDVRFEPHPVLGAPFMVPVVF
ncbi:hypothetical protein IVB18_24465 [Bradyrhizobium sp. 186]|uniref:hypothetical protein n=1 Tax=Bradyrhizobium sp. 186 TaxID=2782654 RepID=UPI002001447E|nr:hypothetical protein [Bradyrhizobium sp. 186]UPK40103.1 hypothetical protein IVB18_24465 [Bradyrhizobium sp. 186]